MAREQPELGKTAERVARIFLKKQGYSILKSNYACACGEIDIVAREGHCLAFVEVKARRDQELGPPSAALTPAKVGQLRKAAKSFLARHNLAGIDCRFDVVSVLWPPDAKKPLLELIKDAFRLDGNAGS